MSPSDESSSDSRSCSTRSRSRRKSRTEPTSGTRNSSDQRHRSERAEHDHCRRDPAHLGLRHQVLHRILEHERQEDPDEHDQEGVADRRERREYEHRGCNEQHRSHRQDQLNAPRLLRSFRDSPGLWIIREVAKRSAVSTSNSRCKSWSLSGESADRSSGRTVRETSDELILASFLSRTSESVHMRQKVSPRELLAIVRSGWIYWAGYRHHGSSSSSASSTS